MVISAVESTFFQDNVNYQSQHQALEKWDQQNRPVEYRFEGSDYNVVIDQQINSLVVRWYLSAHGADATVHAYQKTDQAPIVQERAAGEPPMWDRIINEGEVTQRPPISFHVPDQTPYKREAILFIAFSCIALYAAKRAHNYYFPRKPIPPRKKYRR